MSFLELSLTARAEQQARIETALEDLGALAVTLSDADIDTPDERAIFEPGVGETPLWQSMVLQALFAADTDRAGLVHALTELVPELTPEQFVFRAVADQDWTRVWMDRYQPLQFGARLWIYPSNIEPPQDSDAVIVRLDPGLAFGTGTHPTTALCLEWLDALGNAAGERALAGKTLVDFGCGSGVLAIAALKLGAARAIGVDNDAQALLASRDNALRNGVSEKMDLYLPQHFPQIEAQLLIANILAGPLGELAPLFAAHTRPGAALALSGILLGQEQELVERYSQWFEAIEVATREDWVRISATRRS